MNIVSKKIIIAVLLIVIAIGGGLGIKILYDNYQQAKIEKQQMEDEAVILAAIDKDYLENLLCYLPVFNEEKPIQDKQFQFLIDYSLAHEGFNQANSSLDLPTVLDGADGVECDIRDGDIKPLRSIKTSTAPFYEAARLMNYDVEITEDYIKQYDPTGYAITYEDGCIKYVFKSMGLTNFYWEAEITNISNGGGKVAVSYQLRYFNMMEGTEHIESRAAMLVRSGDGYVVNDVKVLGEPDDALSIMELVNL